MLIFDYESEYDKKVLEYSSFLYRVKKIEDEYKINIDRDNNSLSFITLNGEHIGEILQSEYKDETFTTNSHLYNVVETKFRGQGYGNILYSLYSELSNIDNNFYLPKTEYTNVVSMIDFYIKRGFKVKGKIISGYMELINSQDVLIFKKIKSDYLSGIKEAKLPYTVMLEKK